MYTCWNYFSLVAIFLAYLGGLMVDHNGFECVNTMEITTKLLLTGFVLNSFIGTLLCFYVGYLYATSADVESDRVYLGRLQLLTITSRKELIYRVCYAMDIICLLLFPV